MTSILDKPEVVAATVRRYLELIAHCSADDLVQRFADDATVEDPVGSGHRVGPRYPVPTFIAISAKPHQPRPEGESHRCVRRLQPSHASSNSPRRARRFAAWPLASPVAPDTWPSLPYPTGRWSVASCSCRQAPSRRNACNTLEPEASRVGDRRCESSGQAGFTGARGDIFVDLLLPLLARAGHIDLVFEAIHHVRRHVADVDVELLIPAAQLIDRAVLIA